MGLGDEEEGAGTQPLEGRDLIDWQGHTHRFTPAAGGLELGSGCGAQPGGPLRVLTSFPFKLLQNSSRTVVKTEGGCSRLWALSNPAELPVKPLVR